MYIYLVVEDSSNNEITRIKTKIYPEFFQGITIKNHLSKALEKEIQFDAKRLSNELSNELFNKGIIQK